MPEACSGGLQPSRLRARRRSERLGHQWRRGHKARWHPVLGQLVRLRPSGEIIARATGEREELLIADIDLARTEHVRRIWPFLRDRRIDAYGDLLRRWRD